MTIVTAVPNDDRAELILQTGYDLANAYDDPMTVLHLISKSQIVAQQQSVRSFDDIEQGPISQEVERIEREIEARLDAIDVERPLDGVNILVRVGDPDDGILQTGKNLDARYIVIGGQKRSPTGKAVFGSITQSILLNADRPIVTVMADEDSEQ